MFMICTVHRGFTILLVFLTSISLTREIRKSFSFAEGFSAIALHISITGNFLAKQDGVNFTYF